KDMPCTKRVVGRYRQTDRSAYFRDLDDHGDIFKISKTRAAILLGHKHAHHAKFAQLFKKLHREMLRLVPFHYVRPDVFFGKIAGHLADHVLVFPNGKIVSGWYI